MGARLAVVLQNIRDTRKFAVSLFDSHFSWRYERIVEVQAYIRVYFVCAPIVYSYYCSWVHNDRFSVVMIAQNVWSATNRCNLEAARQPLKVLLVVVSFFLNLIPEYREIRRTIKII